MAVRYADLIFCGLEIGDVDVYTFEARAGDGVQIRVEWTTAFGGCVELRKPSVPVTDPPIATVCGRVLDPSVITETLEGGLYVLHLYGVQIDVDYQLSLQCLAGPCIFGPPGISGTLAVNGVPLGGHKVKVFQGGVKIRKSVSDADGYYVFDDLPPGTYKIKIKDVIQP